MYCTKGWWLVWNLDHAAASGTCISGKRLKAFFWDPRPLISVSVSLGIQRARRQAWEGRPLHILDTLLKNLAPNRVSMLHFDTVVLILPPSWNDSPVYTFYFLLEKKSLWCSTVCIDPLSTLLDLNNLISLFIYSQSTTPRGKEQDKREHRGVEEPGICK